MKTNAMTNVMTNTDVTITKTDNTITFTGDVLYCDQPTINGRLYSKEILERELKEYQPIIEERRAAGSFNPSEESAAISLAECSHLITKTELKEKEDGKVVLYVTTKVIPELPSGKLLMKELESCSKDSLTVELQPTGIGSVNSTTNRVGEDYQLLGFNFYTRKD